MRLIGIEDMVSDVMGMRVAFPMPVGSKARHGLLGDYEGIVVVTDDVHVHAVDILD